MRIKMNRMDQITELSPPHKIQSDIFEVFEIVVSVEG